MYNFCRGGVLFERELKIFGLDVGFQSLKVVQLSKKLGGWQVHGAVEIPVPKDAVNKNGISRQDEIAAALKQHLPQAKPRPITHRDVFAALPESLTFTKTIVVPLTSEREIRQSITLHAVEYLPVSPEEVYLDYTITKQGAASSEVLLLAQDKRLVDTFVELMEKAGLNLLRLETKQMALARLLLEPDSRENVILLDVGKLVSKISLLEFSVLIATGTAEVGAEAIAAGQNINLLVDKIRTIIQFRVKQLKRPLIINRVFLTGAGANLTGLTQALQIALGAPVALAKPYLHIDGFEHLFAVATGLALDDTV